MLRTCLHTRLTAIVVLFHIALASAAVAQTTGTATVGSKLPPRLASRAGSTPARVLIRVRTTFAPEGRLRSRAAALAQRAAIARATSAAAAAFAATGASDVRPLRMLPWIVLQASPAVLDAIAARADVVVVEEDRPLQPALRQSIPLLHAAMRWAGGLDGSGWTIAVLDSGVDGTHPFLAGKVVREACFSSTTQQAVSLCAGGAQEAFGPGVAAPCDSTLASCAHGTHVAGIAAGRGTDMSGVAPGATLMAVQIFSRFIDAESCGGQAPCVLSYISDQVRALEHVFEAAGPGNAARVASVNLSVSGYPEQTACDGHYAALKDAIDQLASIGIATVVAAGNNGLPDAIGAPACVSSAVAVGATTKADVMAAFSNRAPFLDLVAPGENIVSSVPAAYSSMSGTSMSAPHVAGAWAIARQHSGTATVDQILASLQAMGRPVLDTSTGRTYRRLDLVGTPAAPVVAAPGQPIATVQGDRVLVRWDAAAAESITGYVIFAGTSSGGQEMGVFPIGLATAAEARLAAGTYFVRVAAQSGELTGPPSAETSFSIAEASATSVPTDLSATISGAHVVLTWRSPLGADVLDHVVAVGGAPGSTNLLYQPTGSAATSFEAHAPPGTYYVRVHAMTNGGVTAASNEIIVVVK